MYAQSQKSDFLFFLFLLALPSILYHLFVITTSGRGMGQRKEQVVWSSGLPLDSWCAPGTSDYLKTEQVTASPTWLLLGVCGHKLHLLFPRSLWSSHGLLCGSVWSTRNPRSCPALLSSITLNPEPHPCTWPQHSPLYSRCIPHSLGGV